MNYIVRPYYSFLWTTWEFGLGVYTSGQFEIALLLGPLTLAINIRKITEQEAEKLENGEQYDETQNAIARSHLLISGAVMLGLYRTRRYGSKLWIGTGRPSVRRDQSDHPKT